MAGQRAAVFFFLLFSALSPSAAGWSGVDSSTAALRDRAEDYLHVTVARLDHWLRTGRFVLDVA